MANTAPATEPAKPEESKADKFKRIAENRTNKALDAIAALGGLAAKNNYDYTPEQVSKIIGAMENEISKLKDKFAGKTEATTGFSL